MTFRPRLGFGEFARRLPTTDLYLLNPLASWADANPDLGRLPPLGCVAPNVYTIGQTGIVVRYGRAEDVDRLRRAGVRRLVYVADDDFEAAAEDARLPAPYRARLAAFARDDWPALRDAANAVVVPGAVLARSYGAKARVVPPVWHRPPATLHHFATVARIEVAYLGTGSHSADLEMLAPSLAAALDAGNARLTLFSGGQTPDALARHRHVRVRRPRSWWRYKLALPRMRFHLAVYPLADTPFNRARSANKLYEHAVMGAASLMSPNPALREAAGPVLSSVFVAGGQEEWKQRLRDDLSDAEALRNRAEAVRAHIAATDPAKRAARAWRDILAAEAS